jgi:hypothetical protein
MYIGVLVKYLLFLSDFNENRFLKNTKVSNFMKICQVGATLFHVEGWMDEQTGRHDKAISHCHNFVNVPKNVLQYSYCPQKYSGRLRVI